MPAGFTLCWQVLRRFVAVIVVVVVDDIVVVVVVVGVAAVVPAVTVVYLHMTSAFLANGIHHTPNDYSSCER